MRVEMEALPFNTSGRGSGGPRFRDPLVFLNSFASNLLDQSAVRYFPLVFYWSWGCGAEVDRLDWMRATFFILTRLCGLRTDINGSYLFLIFILFSYSNGIQYYRFVTGKIYIDIDIFNI